MKNTYQSIKQAQRDNENMILRLVRQAGQDGYRYLIPRKATINAISRLEAKNKIRFSKKVHGYVLRAS